MARRQLPIEPFEIVIEAIDAEGRGSGTHDGRPLAVHGALPGERVMARYLLGRKFKGQAETVEVLEASTERATPGCDHFGVCGACTLQHMNRDVQLRFKQRQLDELLLGIGLDAHERLPPLDGGQWAYRRKARLSVREVRKKERTLVGFRERDGRFVTDMRACPILAAPFSRHYEVLAETIGSLEGRARIPQLEVAMGDAGGAVILRHLDALSDGDILRLEAFQAQSGLQVWLQSGGPDTVRPLANADPQLLTYRLETWNLDFTFHPLDFFQVNAPLNELMVRQALEQLQIAPSHRVLDLFCGLGNFTLPMARTAREVVGLEGSAAMTRRAAANAAANGLVNTRFRDVDLYAGDPAAHWPEGGFDRVLLDPPRSGAGPVLAHIEQTGAKRVVYVSCNPVTLASDARQLVERHGFRLLAAGIMDMFPHTPHVESMAVFGR